MRVRVTVLFAVALLVGLGLISVPARHPYLPNPKAEISSDDFAQLISRLSEPEGYFDTDNIISNEAGYLKVLPLIERLGIHDGVYLGVGPALLCQWDSGLSAHPGRSAPPLLDHTNWSACSISSPRMIDYTGLAYG